MEQCACWNKTVHLGVSRKRREQRRETAGRREEMRSERRGRSEVKRGGRGDGETKRGDEKKRAKGQGEGFQILDTPFKGSHSVSCFFSLGLEF